MMNEKKENPTNEEVLKAVQGRSDFLKGQFPNRAICIYPTCQNVVDQTMMGDDTLCCYHRMLIDHWFYEYDGWKYAPDAQDVFTGKLVLQPEADPDKKTYRARWYAWANRLTQEERDTIVINNARSGINWSL